MDSKQLIIWILIFAAGLIVGIILGGYVLHGTILLPGTAEAAPAALGAYNPPAMYPSVL